MVVSVVSLVHVVQALYETQVKMIKDQYRLRGEIDMVMNLASFNFAPQDDDVDETIPVTIVEINMDGLAKPVESVNSEHV